MAASDVKVESTMLVRSKGSLDMIHSCFKVITVGNMSSNMFPYHAMTERCKWWSGLLIN